MKKLISVLAGLSFLAMFLVAIFVIPQMEDKRGVSEEITLEQVQMYETPDVTAGIMEDINRYILENNQVVETETGKVFNVDDITYLRETKESYGESEAHVCGEYLYESIEKPERLYEQSEGFLHYVKEIPIDIDLNYGDIYHKIVFYGGSEQVPST